MVYVICATLVFVFAVGLVVGYWIGSGVRSQIDTALLGRRLPPREDANVMYGA